MVSVAMDVFVPGFAGVLCHVLVFISGEWHLLATRLLMLYVLLYALIAIYETKYYENSWPQGFTSSSIVCGTYALGLWGSMVVYRTRFHPLQEFPGPSLACVSKLWHVFQCLDSKNHLLMGRLHEKYGNFVRTGPSELTIFDPEILQIILEGSKNSFSKPAWYDNLRPLTGLNTHRSKLVHDHRRRVWDHAFTTKALQNYEIEVREYARQLERAIAQSLDRQIDVNQYFYWFSFDVMGQFAFSKSFDMLKNRQWQYTVQMLRAGLALVGPFTPVPWLVRIAFDLPIMSIVRDFQGMERWCARRMDERIECGSSKHDVSHYLIDWSAKHHRIAKDRNTLYGDSIAMIIAGSDTVALTLVFIFYYLAKYPEHLRRLQQELDATESIDEMRKLQSLPHLNGIINETLRLHPAVPTGGLRETPSEGTVISRKFIPGNTTICAPRYTIGRLESCFAQASEFIPERWYSKPEMIKNRSAFAPFALGRYYCIGKNLAYLELRYAVALLVSKYDMSFALGDDGRRVIEDTIDQFTASPGQLKLVFRHRV